MIKSVNPNAGRGILGSWCVSKDWPEWVCAIVRVVGLSFLLSLFLELSLKAMCIVNCSV